MKHKPTLWLKLNAVRAMLSPLVRWGRQSEPLRDGYSLVIGVPWLLRHLLSVNLRFVRRCDLSNLHRIHVIFDRPPQPGAEDLIERTRASFGDLPLAFRFHPPLAGRIVRLANSASLFACMNWTHGVKDCQTRHAIMHDFDLYPFVPEYFESLYGAMRDRGLQFTGTQHTIFDGLSVEDNIIGTWALGVDVAHLRSRFSPTQLFQMIAKVNGHWRNLDGFSYAQSRSPRRELVGTIGENDFAHADNLCSVYLRYRSGQAFNAAWRLHYLWYLESLADQPRDLAAISEAMDGAASPVLELDAPGVDFSDVHVTCANVLAEKIAAMDHALFGEMRPPTRRYLDACRGFLNRFGDRHGMPDASPATAAAT